MKDLIRQPTAFFLSTDGNIYPDALICSGILPSDLEGKPCPFSVDGQIPDPLPLSSDDPTYTPDKGEPGDFCPPCAKQQLGHLGHWQRRKKPLFPEQLLSLRLFKCNQWFWLVVPGLYDSDPKTFPSCKNSDHPL